MKRLVQSFVVILAIWAAPVGTRAQLWSGIIDPSRAIDWTQAGFPGTVPPDANWTQCGSTIAPYGSSSSPASGSTITNAVNACSPNTYVQLGVGTFYLSSGFNISKNNVVVRGAGANQTFLIMSGHNGCLENWSAVCLGDQSTNGIGSEQNVCDWTAGYTQGTTAITLANCGSTAPATGSLSNLKVGSILILDQLDETTDTGSIWNCNGPTQGEVSSSPNYLVSCIGGQPPSTDAYEGGFQRVDGPCNNTYTCTRGQQQVVVVTAISGSSITVSPGLYMPNWRSSQKPQAWFSTTVTSNSGLEDMSIDNTNANGSNVAEISNCYMCWVKGIRGVYAARAHVSVLYSKNAVVENNYFYEGQTHAAVSYGAEYNVVSDGLFINNICQQVTDSCPNNNGGAEGNVFAYNMDIDNVFAATGIMTGGEEAHAGGDAMNLREGNIAVNFLMDAIHGTHQFETFNRNVVIGNQNAGCGTAGTNTCNNNTIPIELFASSRYFNVIGNVLGDPGRTQITVYQYTSASTGATHTCTGSGGCFAIYHLGYSENAGWSYDGNYNDAWCATQACSAFVGYDTLTSPTLLRWGNWDNVTAGCGSSVNCTTSTVRWCGSSSDTGWSTTCASASEVPTSLWSCNNKQTVCSASQTFSNAIPSSGDTGAGQSNMVPSFYFSVSAKPSGGTGIPFWKNPTTGYIPSWPPIGPDVTTGNLGRCSGGTYGYAQASQSTDCSAGGGTLVASFGGHANATPVMECFLHVMGGPPNGTGSVLSFNEAACYANDTDPVSGGNPPAAPTGLTAVVQ